VLPTCEIGNDPIVIRDYAQTAEELGYSHLLLYDHVMSVEHAQRTPALEGPYVETDAFHEPMVLLSHLAAVTKRIELATGVLVLPQRQTVLVAKQAAELAILSEGRFRLGVGIGWNWVEYGALGVPFAERGKRLESQVEVMRRLWKEPVVEHEDTFHRIERAAIVPRPEQTIPIWFGGTGPASARRAARIGDGFIFGTTHESALETAAFLREEREAIGRGDSPFGCEALIGFGLGPGVWLEALDRWRAFGLTHLTVRTMSTGTRWNREPDPGFTKPQEHIASLERFIAEMPAPEES
jgi:probable F420-dependent oxidoreductase